MKSFGQPVVEFFYKWNEKHDPIIELELKNDGVVLYDAHTPILRREPIRAVSFRELSITLIDLALVQELILCVFEIL